MTGIVVITHGDLAPGLKNATNLIMGPQESFEVISLLEGADLEEFSNDILTTIKKVDDEGVLVFVDLFGATPFNSVAKIKRDLEKIKTNLALVSGVNLPMLLEALTTRENKDFNMLSEDVVQSGRESIELVPLMNDN